MMIDGVYMEIEMEKVGCKTVDGRVMVVWNSGSVRYRCW